MTKRKIYRESEDRTIPKHRREREVVYREPIYQPTSQSGFPRSIFWLARIVLFICLVLSLPMLMIAFDESIQGVSILLVIFSINEFICRANGWHRLDGDN